MTFEVPPLKLRYGSGHEATGVSRDALRDKRLAPDSVPSVEQVLQAYPVLGSAQCIFVSGSVTLGWGHANSDLDLYVMSVDPIEPDHDELEVFEERISTRDSAMRIAIGEIGQFRADIELWSEAQVDELINRFSATAPGQDVPALGRSERDMLYRLTIGMPLSGHAWWQARRQAILSSSYGLWLAENRKLHAEGALEDASGLLVSGDLEAAVLSAREAYVAGLEALLALYGDFSLSQKWLHRRLVAAQPKEITVEEGRDLLLMADCADDLAGWVRRAVQATQIMILAVERRAVV